MSRPSSVVLAGGGTAGHIEPMLALADALRRRDGDLRITCLGTARGMETRLVPARGYDLRLRSLHEEEQHDERQRGFHQQRDGARVNVFNRLDAQGGEAARGPIRREI